MKLNKPYTNKEYADLVVYCDTHNCHIEDMGNYLESVINPEYVPTKDDIRAQRQARFVAESDPLKMDYDEAAARGAENADELKTAWLAKKDEIRADLPYPVETDAPVDETPAESTDNSENPNSDVEPPVESETDTAEQASEQTAADPTDTDNE